MRLLASRKGFSLVELLTVIAIIAILASIIFPVMGVVGNKARMNKCMVQLHEVGLALQMFKQDNRRYPDILGMEVATEGSTGVVIPFDQVRGNPTATVIGLFPEYVKAARMLHCPMSKIIDVSATGTYNPGPGPIEAYTYNSYDFMIDSSGALQQHYSRSWANDSTTGGVGIYPVPGDTDARRQRDYERQLKFRTPPDDTVVTWCSWHEVQSGGSASGRAPVLFLDGHADAIEANIIDNQEYRTLPKVE